jgi:hypothetical protein
MSEHTPGPWTIGWYECVMDKSDVEHQKSKGNLTAKVGDVLWRQPSSIGPCGISHSHWGGNLLTVEEADARLIAAAPDLLEALQAYLQAFENHGITNTTNLDSIEHIAELAYAAIDKAIGVTNAN